jgi:hypothetical protein
MHHWMHCLQDMEDNVQHADEFLCSFGVFSSPELKAQVSFSDRLLSVVCPAVCTSDICLLDFLAHLS